MAVTLNDVAQRAGVSRSAVSRTYTAGASVSQSTRRKVERAARELGYQPNALASSLTTGRTKLIGLVSNNFENPLFLQIFDLFTRALQDRGLRPLLVNLSSETDPKNSVRMLQQYSVDGVVVASSTLPTSFAEAFHQAEIAVVHAFGRLSGDAKVHVVGIDNIECGRTAARTLIARGYKHIGFLGGPRSATTTEDRLSGFSEILARHSDVELITSFAEAYSFAAGRAEMQRLLQGPSARAYFCGDDVIAIGALSALQDAGYTAPHDIGILGFNDMEMAGWENIGLTTIRQPIPEIVNSSVELMVALLENPNRFPEARVFACNLVDRKTL